MCLQKFPVMIMYLDVDGLASFPYTHLCAICAYPSFVHILFHLRISASPMNSVSHFHHVFWRSAQIRYD
jgi:hypothetical protein